MVRYQKRYWALAAGLAGLAGYVDALGFMKLGGFFVSFMSGNSTRLAVGLATDEAAAAVAGSLVAMFVLGVILGSGVAAAAGSHRKPAVLVLVALLLASAAAMDNVFAGRWPALVMAAAMGAENAVFQRDGQVSIGVTYMTGTLVKLGQSVAAALMGGHRWHWLSHLSLWCALTCGAVLGALAFRHLSASALWIAALVALLFALYAAAIGPAERRT